MTRSKYTFLFALAFMGGLFLSGCGKKGAPTLPEGEPDFYPLRYPPVEDNDN